MALEYLQVILVVMSSVVSEEIKTTAGLATSSKAILDPKRRHDLVDEAFSEQKGILLDMLEAKLKEVRDKKKKNIEPVEFSNGVVDPLKCDLLLSDVDLNIKGDGIIAVGGTDVHLKFGESGSILNLNATGISNVGKTYVKLNLGDGYPSIPGLNDLLSGPIFARNPCKKLRNDNDVNTNNNESILRKGKQLSNSSISKTSVSIPSDTQKNRTKDVHVTLSTSSKSTSTSL